jgi:hypothetical protein
MKKIALAVGMVVVLGTAGVAVGALTNRSAPITKFDGVDEIIEACTTTSTFKNVPQMTKTFTQGAPGSVAVMFQGALSLDTSSSFDTGFLRLTVDGVQQTPGEVPAIGSGDRGTHGFNWQTAPLGAGAHTARVQWRTDVNSQLCVDARSLLVLHR